MATVIFKRAKGAKIVLFCKFLLLFESATLRLVVVVDPFLNPVWPGISNGIIPKKTAKKHLVLSHSRKFLLHIGQGKALFLNSSGDSSKKWLIYAS